METDERTRALQPVRAPQAPDRQRILELVHDGRLQPAEARAVVAAAKEPRGAWRLARGSFTRSLLWLKALKIYVDTPKERVRLSIPLGPLSLLAWGTPWTFIEVFDAKKPEWVRIFIE